MLVSLAEPFVVDDERLVWTCTAASRSLKTRLSPNGEKLEMVADASMVIKPVLCNSTVPASAGKLSPGRTLASGLNALLERVSTLVCVLEMDPTAARTGSCPPPSGPRRTPLAKLMSTVTGSKSV